MKRIKISAKSLLQAFHPCTPEFIKEICHGSCCESHTKGRNTMITVHPSEKEWIDKMLFRSGTGGRIENGLLVTGKKCPFKTSEDLCSIHTTKPFGCIASPFTLNTNDTLIVRNRYRMLRCYRIKEGKVPAYIAHRGSLNMLLGEDEAERVINHIKNGIGKIDDLYDKDLIVEISEDVYYKLKDNDLVKKAVK